MSSPLRRLLTRIWRPTGYVGSDLKGISTGNSFFEHPTPFGEGSLRKSRRVVKYSKELEDPWDQVTNARNLAVQWRAWLSHTRIDPPTIEELQNDEIRVERLKVNVARLKAQDEEMRALEAAQTMPRVAEPTRTSSASKPAAAAPEQEKTHPQTPYHTDLPPPPEVQTEAWTPRLGRRRTGSN